MRFWVQIFFHCFTLFQRPNITSFDFERTCLRWFQNRVVRTNFDIYVFGIWTKMYIRQIYNRHNILEYEKLNKLKMILSKLWTSCMLTREWQFKKLSWFNVQILYTCFKWHTVTVDIQIMLNCLVSDLISISSHILHTLV